MNILVTGATGFIGSHLVDELLRCNEHAIFCVARNPRKAQPLTHKGAIVVEADITDSSSLQKLQRHQIDIVFHCAAAVTENDPVTLSKTNIDGTEHVCELAFRLSVRRMVYVSSVAVVSGHDSVPLREDLPYRATNAYGSSKIAAEKKVLLYRSRGLPVVIVRPPMVYGEDEPHMMRRLLFLLAHRLLPLIDNGEHKLHLAYVKNVVAAMLGSLENKDFLDGAFFVADKEVLSIREIFAAMCEGMGKPLPFSVPAWLTKPVLKIPFIGKKINFFAKDRIYSTERIEALGFCQPYPAYESLVRSSRLLYYGK